MKAWLLDQPGLDHLHIGEIDRPTPGAGELLIRVEVVALNPVDYKVGSNGNPNWSYPHILGVDLVGEVVEVGSSIANIITGSRVAVHTDLSKYGGFAEYTVVDARACAVVPQGVSDEAAASILCAGMTAYEAVMQKLNTRDKEMILIHAGAGGVGGFAIQLAKRLGLKVFTTASPENVEWVESLGADVVIDYNVEDVTARIMEETDGRGVDLILNTVGRDVATADLDRLAFSGHLAYIAGPPDMTNMKGFTLSPSIHEVALGAAHASEDEHAIRNLAYMAEEMMNLLDAGELNDLVTEVLSFDQLKEGLEKLQTRKVRGKLIVRIRD
ncbi:zinc-binding dehydrogenase [Exiguobacterium profundum]|uniref:zinc-binding dehydrogenase n=1 Tax=Exiguobacterium profundum TaxID=307643 RepID=UPI003519BC41